MVALNFARPRAVRKMFVASIDAIGVGIVGLVLQTSRPRNTYSIALPVSHPASAAFGDEPGQLDSFFDLQGSYVDFHFCLPVSDADIEYVDITKIKKVKATA